MGSPSALPGPRRSLPAPNRAGRPRGPRCALALVALAAAVALAGCGGGPAQDEVAERDGDEARDAAAETGDAGDGELPEMPEAAEEAVRQQPVAAEEDGWRRELGQALEKPALKLTDQHGQPYDLRAETAGTATLLMFGFTNCTDACPAQMAILASVVDELPDEQRERLEVVFVSVDPERDTPERLREWLAQYDEDFVGLTGDRGQVDAAMGDLLMSPPRSEEPDEDGDYYVHHHTPFVAFHPDDDRARTMYPLGMRPDHWREELPRLIRGEDLTG